jgi:hypothetical protein
MSKPKMNQLGKAVLFIKATVQQSQDILLQCQGLHGDNNVFPLEKWTATHRIYIFHSHGALQVLTFVTPLFVETNVDTNSSRTQMGMIFNTLIF